jgi:hypothetical protein
MVRPSMLTGVMVRLFLRRLSIFFIALRRRSATET